MINLNSLLAITESGGYYGGACYDMMPEITLDEATGMLPRELSEMHAELSAGQIKYNDMLAEAALSGSLSSADYIIEMSFNDIKEKIKSIFQKIINFLKSIIAKIGVEIDKVRMTGNELWSRYRNSDYINNKTFKGLSIEGYPNIITEADPLKKVSSFTSKDSVVGLIKKVTKTDMDYNDIKQFFSKLTDYSEPRNMSTNMSPGDRLNRAERTGIGADSDEAKAIKSATKKLTDMTTEDQVAIAVKEVTGFTDLGKDWKTSLIKKIYGTKGPIKYGEKGFNISGLEPVLKEPKDLDTVRSCYSQVLQGVENFKADIQRTLDDLPTEREGDKSNYYSLLESWYRAYMQAVTNAYNAINGLQDVNYKYQQARLKQAKAMFVKMMNYKEEKKNNSSAYDLYYDDIDMMDFDI